MTVTGKRTLLFAVYGATVLLAGFALVPPEARGAAFVFFSGGIGVLVGAVATKSAVGALAAGGGVQGAKAALLTDAKPGQAPPAT